MQKVTVSPEVSDRKCTLCIPEKFVYFVVWHINLIGHLMPNQVKENKTEKKVNGEVLGINDKL